MILLLAVPAQLFRVAILTELLVRDLLAVPIVPLSGIVRNVLLNRSDSHYRHISQNKYCDNMCSILALLDTLVIVLVAPAVILFSMLLTIIA